MQVTTGAATRYDSERNAQTMDGQEGLEPTMRSRIGSLVIGILAFLIVMTAIAMDILTMGLPNSVAGTPAYLLLLFGSNAAMGIMAVYGLFIWDPVKSLRRKMSKPRD